MHSRARIKLRIFQVGVVALLLAACQSGPAPLAPTPTNSAPSAPVATIAVVTAPAAETAASAYMEYLKSRDYDKATAAISDYSLGILNGTRDQIRTGMDTSDKGGYRTLDYKVLDSRTLTPQTSLVRMLIKTQMGTQAPQTADVWLALRMENNQWRINAGPSSSTKLVDDITLSTPAQTVNNVTIQPVRMIRFTDRIRVLLNVENTNGDKRVALWAYGKDPFATFHFAATSENVNGGGGGVTFVTGQKYTNTTVDISGLYAAYPDSIDLINWQWATPATPPAPDTSVAAWKYNFKLQ